MKYALLLFAGGYISLLHAYLVWLPGKLRKFSISENAAISQKSYLLYMVSHLAVDLMFLAYSYQFFLIELDSKLLFYMNLSFIIFDTSQALTPARGKTKMIHSVLAYVGWVSFLSAGTACLFLLDISRPYSSLATILLVPILGMFAYMHVSRSKLYPFQLLIIPLFIVYLLLITIGAS